MPGFSLRKLLDVVTPRMIVRGLIYPLRTALHTARPALGGGFRFKAEGQGLPCRSA